MVAGRSQGPGVDSSSRARVVPIEGRHISRTTRSQAAPDSPCPRINHTHLRRASGIDFSEATMVD
jgi:hypothetical protein